ncbi:MAG: serine--tRNA ligase, partial [Nanoarchaeota archaeon]
MIDIKLVRENPEIVKENIKKKFQNEKIKYVEEVFEKDKKWRSLKKEVDELRHSRNKISQEISELKKSGKDKEVEKLMKKAKQIPDEIAKIEENTRRLEEEIHQLMLKIPNIIHKSVPIGKNAEENVVKEKIGKIKDFSFDVKNHAELGESLGVLDFDSSAKISGNGFYVMKGDLALLNQALISYAREF